MVRAHLPRRRRSSNLGEAIGLQALWMITKASAGGQPALFPKRIPCGTTISREVTAYEPGRPQGVLCSGPMVDLELFFFA
jgi:hypothetical protein